MSLPKEKTNQQETSKKYIVDINENLHRFSKRLPSTIEMTRSLSGNSVVNVVEKGYEAYEVVGGWKKAVTFEDLEAYKRKIKVLSDIIKLILGSNKKIENFLKSEFSTAEDFLKAFQKPSYEEMIYKITQLERLGNEMREQVETLSLNIKEEEDRKKLEKEIVHLKNLNQEYEEIVKELEDKIRIVEEIVGVDNHIISVLEENSKELQKKLNIRKSEINSLNRCLESKIDDKERLTELTAELKSTILDSVDACALFYKNIMLLWLENDLKNDGNNLKNKFDCLKQLLESNRETKTDQRWQDLFNSFNNFERNLENLLREEWQEKSKLKELEKQENELLNRRSQLTQEISQLTQEVESLQQQINGLRSEKDMLSERVPSINLKELTKKLEHLEKELDDKTKESRSIEEKLSKNEKELKEVTDNKNILAEQHRKFREIRENGWNKRTLSPQVTMNDKKEKTKTIAHLISDNNLKVIRLQREKGSLEKELINKYRGNEGHYKQMFMELKPQVKRLSHENKLYSELYSLEKPLNSAKDKVREKNLIGLLNVYKSGAREVAKNELSKELSDEELEAILEEDEKRRKIEELLKEIKRSSQR